MIYLVKASVRRSLYMAEKAEEPQEVLRLVEAESYENAQDKFKKHYEEQGSEYSHSYFVDIDDISSIIT